MRDLNSEILAQINKREGIKPRVLWWVKARNRDTGESEDVGFWNGDDHQVFTINDQTRTYYAAGNILSFGQMIFEAALNIRMFSVNVSVVSPEMEVALRGYETRYAPTEVHLAFFNPETNELVSEPFRIFKGWVNKIKIKTPKVNEPGNGVVELVGHTRLLTKVLAAKRSDQNQRKRSNTDTFYRDVAVTGTVITPWGEKGVAGGGSGGLIGDAVNGLIGQVLK